MLHAPHRQVELPQQAVVGEHCEYVGQGVAYSED